MVCLAILSPVVALRAGLRAILASPVNEPANDQDDFEVVFEAGSLADFVGYSAGVDVLILDGDLVGDPNLDRIVVNEEGQLGLLVLSENPRIARSLKDLPLRAWGILSVEATSEELKAAVRAIAAGLLVGTPALLEYNLSGVILARPEDADFEQTTLTERERQVLQLLALGLANKQIAHQLEISEHTVKFHISSIYTRLGVTNRTEAVRAGVKHGLITL